LNFEKEGERHEPSERLARFWQKARPPKSAPVPVFAVGLRSLALLRPKPQDSSAGPKPLQGRGTPPPNFQPVAPPRAPREPSPFWPAQRNFFNFTTWFHIPPPARSKRFEFFVRQSRPPVPPKRWPAILPGRHGRRGQSQESSDLSGPGRNFCFVRFPALLAGRSGGIRTSLPWDRGHGPAAFNGGPPRGAFPEINPNQSASWEPGSVEAR